MINKKRILVVDDEKDLCDILSLNLHMAGYEVEASYSAEEALDIEIESFDLLILDVMMEGMSGFDMAKVLKKNPATASIPIIFLTAKDTEDDILKGFGLGADDYISKPFFLREVLARVKAVLARTSKKLDKQEDVFSYKGIKVNYAHKSVWANDSEVPVTRTEFDILRLLLSHPGKVFSRQELIESVWPKDVIVTERTVDVNITRLRKKLGSCSDLLCTRQGFGYCII